MSGELETGALASVGGLSSNSGQGRPEPEACRNCGVMVEGRYCGECGQLAQNFHKPIWGLASEMLGDFLSLDGRVMQTLPAMMWRPGRVTRDYLDGKRQSFVPPFRLYLLTSFLFFLFLFAFGDSHHWFDARYATPDGPLPTAINLDVEGAQRALADEGIIVAVPDTETSSDVGPESEPGAEADAEADADADARARDEDHTGNPWVRQDGRVNRAVIEDFQCDPGDEEGCTFIKGILHRIADAYENQGMFFASIQSWAPRLALAFTPALILLLTIVYPFNKKIFVYDHIITALHLQSWLYLLLCIGLLFFWVGQVWFSAVLFILPAVYFYRTFRVVYGSGRILSFLRMGFVLASLNVVLILLTFLLAVLGVADTAPIVGGS